MSNDQTLNCAIGIDELDLQHADTEELMKDVNFWQLKRIYSVIRTRNGMKWNSKRFDDANSLRKGIFNTMHVTEPFF